MSIKGKIHIKAIEVFRKNRKKDDVLDLWITMQSLEGRVLQDFGITRLYPGDNIDIEDFDITIEKEEGDHDQQ